jgi:hypothetical protein
MANDKKAKKPRGKGRKKTLAERWKNVKVDPRLEYRGLPNGDR